MSEQDVRFLMEYSFRDLAVARQFCGDGLYQKSINESYYAAFYAAKACLLHLGIKTKSHKSVQIAI